MDGIKPAATAVDISHVVKHCIALQAAINSPQEVDPAWVGAKAVELMRSPFGVIFISSHGFIAGQIIQTFSNPAPVAVELGWFASDRSGLLLLRAFEVWAGQKGASAVKFSTGVPAGTAGRILEKRGFNPVEMAWVK